MNISWNKSTVCDIDSGWFTGRPVLLERSVDYAGSPGDLRKRLQTLEDHRVIWLVDFQVGAAGQVKVVGTLFPEVAREVRAQIGDEEVFRRIRSRGQNRWKKKRSEVPDDAIARMRAITELPRSERMKHYRESFPDGVPLPDWAGYTEPEAPGGE